MYGRKMRLAMLEDYELWYCAGVSCQKSSWNTVLGNCQWTKWLQDSYGHLPGLYRTYTQNWGFRSQHWGNADHNESQDKLCFGSLVQESLDVITSGRGRAISLLIVCPFFYSLDLIGPKIREGWYFPRASLMDWEFSCRRRYEIRMPMLAATHSINSINFKV